MYSLFGYLRNKPVSEISQHLEQQIAPPKIDYEKLEKCLQSLDKNSNSFLQAFNFPNEKVVGTFQQLMGVLHGLINVIDQLKHQIEENEHKIQDYDNLKSKVNRHDQIIRQFQQRQDQQTRNIYEMKINLEKQYTNTIQKMEQSIKRLTNENNDINKQLLSIRQANQSLLKQIQQINKENTALQAKCQEIANKLEDILTYQSAKQPDTPINKYNSLPFLMKYQNFRKRIYSYLDPVSLTNFQVTCKQINFFIHKTFKKQYIPLWYKNCCTINNNTMALVKEAQKMYDKFPSQNIKSNAMKYLFFKMKPGSYIVPFLNGNQKIEETQNHQVKKSTNKWGNLFKWKQDTSKRQNSTTQDQHKVSIDNLKNQQQFQETQAQIQIFFDKLFKIQMPQDLHIFRKITEKQLNQLKDYLQINAGHKKSQHLLILSKFLYLQTNQLNNLLQVCFALLVNQHIELVSLKKQFNDKEMSQKTLRNLIQNIANERSSIQKRIWELQNEAIKAKIQMQKSQSIRFKIQKQSMELAQVKDKMDESIRNYKSKYEHEKKQRLKFEGRYHEIQKILKQFTPQLINQEI